MAQPSDKIPRPQISELRDAYKGIISASIEERIEAMKKGLLWFDSALLYLTAKGGITGAMQKNLSIANKARALGIQAGTLEEKETSFLLALKRYEAFAAVTLNPPSVEEYHKRYRAEKADLLKVDALLQDKFKFMLDALSSMFKVSGLTFHVSMSSKSPRSIGPDGKSIVYSKQHANDLRSAIANEGVFSLFAREVNHVSRAMAFKMVEGKPVISPAVQVEAYQKLLAGFHEYAKSDAAPSKIVKDGTASTAINAPPSAPTRSSQPRSPSSGTHVNRVKSSGSYRAGSASDVLYRLLADEKEHDMSELKKLPTSDTMSILKRLIRHGTRDGGWNITVNGSKIRMKIT